MDDQTAPKLGDDEACATAIARMGQLDRELAVIEAAKAEAVERASVLAEKSAEPHIAERAKLFEAVKIYCVENRDRLTDGGRRKTAPFTTGEAAWRLGRQRINIDSTLKEKIIALLKKRGLSDLVKTKEDIDVTALGKAKDKVKGIKGITFVPPAEDFSVSPITAELVERS
ncbi:host-nuclease inhibitor Gam family protein [Kaistia dalseonensis]|uniref:Phage host-nuclease inhibitor protein Gam n=1 Tax=Kaistia dalseonensis TaxID=410840 RepID=A0ABU0H7W2_9HYPH|nr:host-nuclease inhibitor Gam family protein [Kaistia dalseonensis]MCX5495795.1 host-nuclease inhibitor Gam family protein [Kaistia dalseonensis]MDQ0438396.1 phage host-nuclease inhibitor protein Gam [Kaistia dalseonensis]